MSGNHMFSEKAISHKKEKTSQVIEIKQVGK
jgi:hypothetical protein